MNKIIVIVGAILVVVGIFFGTYQITDEGPFGITQDIEIPYAQWMIPFIAIGIIVMIAGAIINRREKS